MEKELNHIKMIARLKNIRLGTGEKLIDQLIRLDRQRYLYDPARHRERRKTFDDTKLDRFSLRGKRCQACGEWAQCRHHIFELQHGGVNHKRNIVYLCHRCHARIHPWLRDWTPTK